MSDWWVYLDCNDGYEELEICGHELDEVIEMVQEALEDLNGGHADIFDENDNFVDDVEI